MNDKIDIIESDQKVKLPHQEFLYFNPLKVLLIVVIPFSLGFALGIKYLLPLLTAIPASWILVQHIRKGRAFIGVVDMILYVLWLTVIGLLLMYFFPVQAEKVILNGTGYWEEMTPWLQGQQAKEGTPSEFIPEHIKHMLIVAVASLISAGFIALTFGTILMNYMNFYVSNLMLLSEKPLLMAVIGWHPWSICRVIAFIILGAAFAWPIVSRLKNSEKINYRYLLIMIGIAVLLEAADILIKTYLGSSWRDLLVQNIVMINI